MHSKCEAISINKTDTATWLVFRIRKAVTKGFCILSLYMGEIGVLLFLNFLAGCGTLNTRYLRKPCLLRKLILNFHALLAIRDAIPQLLF